MASIIEDIEKNQERINNNEIAVQVMIMEQKVEKVEQAMQMLQMSNNELVIKEVCKEIDTHSYLLIPKVMQKIADLKKELSKQQFQYIGDLQSLNKKSEVVTEIGDELKALKFNMNVFKSEVDVMKRTFTTSRLVQIDKNSTRLNEIKMDIELLQVKQELSVPLPEFHILVNQCKRYLDSSIFEQYKIEREEESTVLQAEFQPVALLLQKVDKEQQRFMDKDECLQRLNLFMSNINAKYADVPTIGWVKDFMKKNRKVIEEKIASNSIETKSRFTQLDMTNKQKDSEFNTINLEIGKIYQIMDLKLEKTDGKALWKNFQRFSEYEDLRELYNKVVPEIIKFESKIMDYQADLNNMKVIVRKFDEDITKKADKHSIKTVYATINSDFEKKGQLSKEFDKEIKILKIKTTKIDECIKEFKILEDELGQRITKQIKGATAQYRKSIYDTDDNENKKTGGGGTTHAANDKMMDLIKRKVDIRDFTEQIKTKTNKKDHEMTLRQIDILHRQIKATIIIQTQLQQVHLQNESVDTMHTRRNRHVQLMHHITLVSNWVQNFDPYRIDDIFQDGAPQLPQIDSELDSGQLLDLEKIKRMQLSPNMQTINNSIKKNTGLISQSINNTNGITISVRKDQVKKNVMSRRNLIIKEKSIPNTESDDTIEIIPKKRTRNNTLVSQSFVIEKKNKKIDLDDAAFDPQTKNNLNLAFIDSLELQNHEILRKTTQKMYSPQFLQLPDKKQRNRTDSIMSSIEDEVLSITKNQRRRPKPRSSLSKFRVKAQSNTSHCSPILEERQKSLIELPSPVQISRHAPRHLQTINETGTYLPGIYQ